MTTGPELIDLIRAEKSSPPSGIRTLGLDQTHRWLDSVEPGRVALTWTVDDRYLNLEGAVICSWIVALADQAIFYAGMTLCGENEVTRMVDIRLTTVENINSGDVSIIATVDGRSGDDLLCTCDFRSSEGVLLARIAATVTVVRA